VRVFPFYEALEATKLVLVCKAEFSMKLQVRSDLGLAITEQKLTDQFNLRSGVLRVVYSVEDCNFSFWDFFSFETKNVEDRLIVCVVSP
jgi:hypothetical protein